MKPTLIEADFKWAAAMLGCSVPAIKAVCEVEAPQGGFNPDGTPRTLFEGHKFHQFTGGRFSGTHPNISYPKWTKQHYGRSWQAEQGRLQVAMALDRDAALKSASWGKFQIMGFNHADAGHPTLQGFVNAMYAGEGAQLESFVNLITKWGLAPALRSRDWAKFARVYNGAGYAANKYDDKLAAAYRKYGGV